MTAPIPLASPFHVERFRQLTYSFRIVEKEIAVRVDGLDHPP